MGLLGTGQSRIAFTFSLSVERPSSETHCSVAQEIHFFHAEAAFAALSKEGLSLKPLAHFF